MDISVLIEEKESMLKNDFKVHLTANDIRMMRRCTTESSLEMAVRTILLTKWEADERIARSRARRLVS